VNTVEKGDSFENLCFELISRSMDSNPFGVTPERAKIRKKPRYYSSKREKDIEFDLSVEIWPTDSDRPSLIILIECKNYKSPVPVKVIDEFGYKVNQVAEHNSKAVIMTSSSFQEGAFNVAKNTGMMLIAVSENITLNIVLYKVGGLPKPPRIEVKETQKAFAEFCKSLIRATIQHVRGNTFSLTHEVRKLSASFLEEFAKSFYQGLIKESGANHRTVSFEVIKSFLERKFQLKISIESISDRDANGNKILAKCSFVDKLITVDRDIYPTRRFRFVLFHEIGHYVLHNKLVINQIQYESFSDPQFSFQLDRFLLENPKNWMEWQANQFASCLLMPKMVFLSDITKTQKEIGLQGGHKVYLDDQLVNRRDFYSLVGKLSDLYDTTQTSIIYRLKALSKLDIRTKVKSVGQILAEILREPGS